MLNIINSFIWAIATVLIIASSVYFSFSLKFVQLNFKEMLRNLFKKENTNKGISPIQSFLMTLGSRVGVGSIAGVSLAVYLGGIGSIFWMWISAFLAASSTFCETVLGILYREPDGTQYKGGPAYYIRKGLGNYTLGGLYAILIIVSYVGGFVGIQANTITKSLLQIVAVPKFVVGIVLVIITGFIIYGGLKKIASYSEKIVPIMTIFYLLISMYVAIKNFSSVPSIFINIFNSAFNFKSFGIGILTTLIIGMQRGIFSNEAGLGTGSITSSTSSTDSAASQGYIQMLGIYVTTLLICTATAVIVLTSNYQTLVLTDVNGIEITQYAFQYHLVSFGNIALFIPILLFAFSSILTGYYDGESSLKYFFNKITDKQLGILKILSLFVLFLGSIISSELLWTVVDIFVGFLAIINIYALIMLKKDVKNELVFYKKGKCDKINNNEVL